MSSSAITATEPKPSTWLFSMPVDLLTFGGSAAIALLLLAVGWQFGLLHNDTPEWTWVTAVLMVDVAHVYATGFRVYFIPEELKRRPWLYALTPALGYLIGLALYSESETWFWRCLAYLAVFHFIRQQAGWVALYRSRAGEQNGGWFDFLTIYAVTVWPLLWWHDHLPRGFWWFREGDFLSIGSLPPWLTLSSLLQPLYWLLLTTYCLRSVISFVKKTNHNPGKDLVVVSTAICWYTGIVYLNSDFAFTVTNVIIHGVPYIVLVYWLQRTPPNAATPVGSVATRLQRWMKYLCVLWVLAYTEEYFWDRGLWHERSWLFGQPLNWENVRVFLVPLLAVPQLTHYILDGFIWRRQANPDVQCFVRD